MKKTIYSAEQGQIIQKLIDARKKAGLTQERVAKSIGRTQSFIAKVESGQRRVDVVLLKGLANIYKISIQELI